MVYVVAARAWSEQSAERREQEQAAQAAAQGQESPVPGMSAEAWKTWSEQMGWEDEPDCFYARSAA
jgi:hypothetical protein